MHDDDAAEFTKTQTAAEELLREIAGTGMVPDPHTIVRLEKFAAAVARLAYGRGCIDLMSDEMNSLVAWTDHLDEPQWKESFMRALLLSPLESPFKD